MSSKIGESYKNEFVELSCSSRKKIVKFIGLLLMPLIYGFICIAAFWNPFAKIGNTPIAIVNLDTPTSDVQNSLVDDFMGQWKDNDFVDLGLSYDEFTQKYVAVIDEKTKLENIEYYGPSQSQNFTSYDVDTNKWNVKESPYYMIIGFPTNFTDNFLAGGLGDITDHSVNKYVSFQKNFVTSEILSMASNFIVSAALAKICAVAIPDVDAGRIVNDDIPNEKFAIYGVGIGEMFLALGTWVGAFSMLSTFDRKKRVKKLNSYQWYMSKSLVAWTFSLLQTLIIMLAVGALGFFGLGMGFFYECMLIAFAGIVFSTMVQGIWYSFRDKTISTFVLIIFLVLNISCGFGTFPSFMQFPIFQYISHIVPFNYLIHAEGAIIFNIASGTNVYENSMIVLKNVGILSIYLVGFFVLGMFMSKRRNREINYGTAKSKDLSLILMQMKLFDKYSTNHKLDWKKLPNEPMEKVIEKVLEKYPYEVKFNWFKKKQIPIIEDPLVLE